MDSPRSGFRRAAAASWALAGIGVAGVAGASALAYADTFKPARADAPINVVEPAPEDQGSIPPLNVPSAPDVVTPTVDPPPPPLTTAPSTQVAQQTTVEQPPVATYTPTPEYTPEPTVEPAPATHEAPPPVVKVPPTTRRVLTPTTAMAPNFSPRVTRSRGS
jgi:hypothetical protein